MVATRVLLDSHTPPELLYSCPSNLGPCFSQQILILNTEHQSINDVPLCPSLCLQGLSFLEDLAHICDFDLANLSISSVIIEVVCLRVS